MVWLRAGPAAFCAHMVFKGSEKHINLDGRKTGAGINIQIVWRRVCWKATKFDFNHEYQWISYRMCFDALPSNLSQSHGQSKEPTGPFKRPTSRVQGHHSFQKLAALPAEELHTLSTRQRWFCQPKRWWFSVTRQLRLSAREHAAVSQPWNRLKRHCAPAIRYMRCIQKLLAAWIKVNHLGANGINLRRSRKERGKEWYLILTKLLSFVQSCCSKRTSCTSHLLLGCLVAFSSPVTRRVF